DGSGPPFFETTQFTSFGTNRSFFMPDLTADPQSSLSWALSGGLGGSGGSEGAASGIGTPGSGPSVVPEPATIAMFAIASMGLAMPWRRRRSA
ncbi:MAG: PEP-CTERM sorting domain-containing protein, partial [Planctomycetota bacterium]